MKIMKRLLPVVLAFSVLAMCSCKNDADETTTYNYETTATQPQATDSNSTTAAQNVTDTSAGDTTAEPASSEVTAAPVTAAPTTQPPVTSAPVTEAPDAQSPVYSSGTDCASWNTAETAAAFVKAVNITKAFTGSVAVNHKESFTSEVTECSIDSSLVKKAISGLLALVIKPSEETFNFNGGKAVTSEGETIPILLPTTGSCSLPAEGVASASAVNENGTIHVKITLVSENCGLTDVPQYNAGAIGYLDVSSIGIKTLKITDAKIIYTGSVIDAYILPNGMISDVTYVINLNTSGTAGALGMSGSATFVGAQTEQWTFKW